MLEQLRPRHRSAGDVKQGAEDSLQYNIPCIIYYPSMSTYMQTVILAAHGAWTQSEHTAVQIALKLEMPLEAGIVCT